MLSQLFFCLGAVFIGSGLIIRNHQRSVEVLVPSRESYRRGVGRTLGEDSDRLWFSVEGLRASTPHLAFDRTLSKGQKDTTIVLLSTVAVFLAVALNNTLLVLIGAVIFLYFGALLVRIRLFLLSSNNRGLLSISDEEALAIAATALPSYSVLVPAYGEPEVIHRLIDNLRAIDYPRDRLEMILLLEADDVDTISAARSALGDSDDIEVVLIPDGGPRTKPKALNYGLAKCTGDLVTIYDAEDRPEPLQLRKAAIALSTAPPDVVCVQAKLDFFNPTQNMLTKWFTLDYRMWFSQLLPGLVQLGAPIPLGGTSNHFLRQPLVDMGAWDPYNVTEDADLGIRLSRLGYRTAVLDSTTYEEANSDAINWVKQRSRWYKGYAQTALVHLRHPRDLHEALGTKGFVLFCLFVGGTPLLAMLNPIFWALTIIWWVFHPHLLQTIIPSFTYYIGQICWLAGNCFVLYSWLLSTRNPKERLWLAAILSPFYWVLMSIAATKAIGQLVTAPSYWEKTVHGLDEQNAEPSQLENAAA